jgi:hypothetical protein
LEAVGSEDGGSRLTFAAYERTSRMEAARSGDSSLLGSDTLSESYEAWIKLLEDRYERAFLVERSVFVLGLRRTKPNASSTVRRSLAAESSSESLAVASVIAGGVKAMFSPWKGSSWMRDF